MAMQLMTNNDATTALSGDSTLEELGLVGICEEVELNTGDEVHTIARASSVSDSAPHVS